MKYVLDAGALFSRIDIDEAYTTAAVCAEVRDRESSQHLERLLASRKLMVQEPTPTAVSLVRGTMGRTGDGLSETDIGVIALARDLSAHIVTDDYGVQNVSSLIGIPWSPAKTAGIRRTLSWCLRCPGCKKRFPPNCSEDVCDVCGSRLVRSKR